MPVKMNIKPDAVKIIEKKIDKNHPIVLLALNDGSNKYSMIGGTCTIGANFQFVTVKERDPEYNIKIENNANFDLYTAKPEMGFLEDNLVVDAQNAALSLSDDSGIIDGAVSTSKFDGSEVTKKDMLEGKTC